MKKTKLSHLVFLAALSCINISAISQTAAQPAPSTTQPVRQPWSQHIRNSTVSIGKIVTIKGKPTFEPVGTGVLIAERTALNTYLGIVTAKHVLDDPSKNWHPLMLQIRFAAEETKPLTEDIGYSIALSDRLGRTTWKGPTDSSDIAIIPIYQQFWVQLPKYPSPVTDALGLDEFGNDADLYEGESIVTFGFPEDVSVLMGQDALVRAVTRAGIVSWIDPLKTGKAFMIDANILPGNSGGPVFRIPGGSDKYGNFNFGGSPVFLGVVTDTVRNEYVESIGGLGRVEPASKIKELFLLSLPPF